MRRGVLKKEETSLGTGTASMASSSTPRDRPRCNCGSIMISFIAKRGRNVGREFLRCANWKLQSTCDMLIWTDEFEAMDGVGEQVESGVAAVGNEIETEAKASAIAVEVMEAGMKKICKLQKKLNAERLRGDAERLKKNIAIFLLIVSLFVNLLLCVKYL